MAAKPFEPLTRCVDDLHASLPVLPIFALEVLASITLLREGLKHCDWRWLSWLALGNALCIPLGLALLAQLPQAPLRLLIGALLLAAALLLSSAHTAPAVMRATMIVLFLFTDLYALAWAALMPSEQSPYGSLVGVDTLRWALWLAPAMLMGIACGQRFFTGVSPARFRAVVLNLLGAIAALSRTRAAIEWLR